MYYHYDVHICSRVHYTITTQQLKELVWLCLKFLHFYMFQIQQFYIFLLGRVSSLNYFHKLRLMQAIERLPSINGLLHIEALAIFVANSIGGMFIDFRRWIRRYLYDINLFQELT